MGMLGYETDTHGISYASWCAKCNLGFNLFFRTCFLLICGYRKERLGLGRQKTGVRKELARKSTNYDRD